MKMIVRLVLTSALLLPRTSRAFAPTAVVVQRGAPLHMGLLGRFRSKKKVDIADPLTVGSTIPDSDVEMLTTTPNGDVVTEPASILEVLGNGTAILVGMPGAFTPTCTSEHLPGYINAAPKLKQLGVDKIAIVTTNDKFVNEEWARKTGLLHDGEQKDDQVLEPAVTILADGDSDAVRSMGLAEDMGFGVGVRSKRFALVSEGGVVSQLFTDEGMDDCRNTRADRLVKAMSPEGAEGMGGMDLDENTVKAIGAGIALLVLFSLASSMGGDHGGTTASVAPAVKATAPAIIKPSSGQGFTLLKEYL